MQRSVSDRCISSSVSEEEVTSQWFAFWFPARLNGDVHSLDLVERSPQHRETVLVTKVPRMSQSRHKDVELVSTFDPSTEGAVGSDGTAPKSHWLIYSPQ